MEHSLQYNYWAYQTIKLYIKDQEKNKMMCDISLIANANGIGISNQSQRAINKHEFNHSSGEGQPPRGNKASSSSANCYDEAIATASMSEFYEKRGKSSLLRNLIH